VPTARVLTSTEDPGVIGAAFMVSEFVDGVVPSVSSIVEWLAEGATAFRQQCARSVVEVLVLLGGASAADSGRPALDEHYAQYLDSTVQALVDACRDLLAVPPSIVLAHKWLRDRVTGLADEPATLTHGDFRIGNLIFQGTSVAALLDWERAGWGHPLYDLGYLCLPGMRHGDRIGGLMTGSELRTLWRDVSGEELDIERVAFFRCMSIFTELVNCVRALVNYTRGRGRASLLRILPLIVRLENDVLTAIERIDAGDAAL
jgi:aminoglycoside phosphotransferase (APT) family kinase protein